MPSFAWINDEMEHSDADSARAAAIAKKITQLLNESEQCSDSEDGRDYDPYEDCECDACIAAEENGCPDCEARKEDERQTAIVEAERELDLEMLSEKLAAVGARMMSAYEHWNEDDRYMQYMESDCYQFLAEGLQTSAYFQPFYFAPMSTLHSRPYTHMNAYSRTVASFGI